MNASNTREKQADLASSAGAGVLGAGLGVLLAGYAASAAPMLVVIGVLLHGWGMLEKRRLQAGAAQPRWADALFWVCWIALAALVAWIAFR